MKDVRTLRGGHTQSTHFCHPLANMTTIHGFTGVTCESHQLNATQIGKVSVHWSYDTYNLTVTVEVRMSADSVMYISDSQWCQQTGSQHKQSATETTNTVLVLISHLSHLGAVPPEAPHALIMCLIQGTKLFPDVVLVCKR